MFRSMSFGPNLGPTSYAPLSNLLDSQSFSFFLEKLRIMFPSSVDLEEMYTGT